MIDGRVPEPARVTRQRTAVLEALRRAPEPLSAKDLHAGLGRSVGLATVYRALQGLVDAAGSTCSGVNQARRCSASAIPCTITIWFAAAAGGSWRSTPAGSSCGRPGSRTATDSPSPSTRRMFSGSARPARAAPETATPAPELARASSALSRQADSVLASARELALRRRDAAAVLEVEPGLRPRFLSVLPRPSSLRSR